MPMLIHIPRANNRFGGTVRAGLNGVFFTIPIGVDYLASDAELAALAASALPLARMLPPEGFVTFPSERYGPRVTFQVNGVVTVIPCDVPVQPPVAILEVAAASGKTYLSPVTPSGPSYDAASTAYFAAMTVQPDATRKGLLNDLIVGLKSDGVWTSLDWLSVAAAHDAQAARINVKTPSQAASVNGTVTFNANRGYAGDAATGFLGTGVADNAGGNYTQNSALLFAWGNTANNSDPLIGLVAGTSARIYPNNAGTATARVNNGGNATLAAADGLGFAAASRLDASNLSIYRNSASATAALNSVALTGSTFAALRADAVFGSTRVAVFGFGGGLAGAQVAALYNRLNTYLTAVGGA